MIHRPISSSPLIALLLLLPLAACSDDGASSAQADASSDVRSDTDASNDASLGDCEDTHRPIVFVHGFLGGGDQFANHAMRFVNNGYCLERIAAFDWNTLDQEADHESALDAFIQDVLAETGAGQVDLAGHSAGGSLSYRYLADAARAARVAHYAHIASGLQEGPAGPDGEVPTVNLWSQDDAVVDDKGDIPGATNVMLVGDDHIGAATSEASFEAIYAFFNDGEEPATTSFGTEAPIRVSGRAVTLGENVPADGWTVSVWPVDSATGFRTGDEADTTFDIDSTGNWGPFEAEPNVPYEIEVSGPSGDDAPGHYYYEPFVRSTRLVYLRVFPPPSTLPGLLLSQVDRDDGHAVVVNFTSSTGLLAGRDSLTVDGVEYADETFAAPESTTLALFLYDAGSDREGGGEPVALFDGIPFLTGADVFFDASTPATIEAVFNGTTLRARNWPSETEGITLIVFR